MVRTLDGREPPMKSPRATYRLQFTREFGFAAAARVAPYLEKLGVSHVYASPYLRARPGSTHGYDIVAHDELNPELGSLEDFGHMCAEFARHGLQQILDFVPNHMGVGGADNPLWLDVLEWGPDSRYAGWFDIDWEPAAGYLAEKLLVPVLDDQYGAALEDGKLVLKFDAAAGTFAVWAHETHKLPIHPLRYTAVLGAQHPALERIGDEFSALREWRPQMQRRANELESDLALLIATDTHARASLDAALGRLNGAQDPERRELNELIRDQYWRASHFRVAGDDINYRRFFNINDLAGLRIELPEVFEHAHRLVVRLLREGAIAGLRIDHIDGLLDPTEYLRRLRALALQPDGASRPFYLIVEKILARDEALRRDWPVEGTTGYEFANLVLRVLTHPGGEEALSRAYVEHAGERQPFAEMVRESKIRILRNEMASELNVLARDAARVARQNTRTADFTRNILRRAIRQTIACFPVYRTYLDASGELAPEDRARVMAALSKARIYERDVDPSVFDFLEMLLSGDLAAAPRSGFSRHAALRCAMKFQQLSGPVMAKGLEDTAFYRYNRLISHNEVGGDPASLAASPEEFHAANAERARRMPHGLLATATHDTKRGEDVRTRLAVLAEMPEEWSRYVSEWRRTLARHSEALNDRNLEYLLYQTLLGSWPLEPMNQQALATYGARIEAALVKSAREARANTSWSAPNDGFERALKDLIGAALASRAFRASFEPLAARVAVAGARNGLVQTVLKLTVPGVPDIYQGTELWDFALVDPDNRRPVDFGARATALEAALVEWRRDPAGTVGRKWQNWPTGEIKLLTIAVLLEHRRQHAALYESVAYRPIECAGAFAGFVRESDTLALAVIFSRYPLSDTADTVAPPDSGSWRNVLTHESVFATGPAPWALQDLPFLVLERAI
jgi:(1->4)-alpha-D-glucan 1-alpha-D-glucosylmutase